MRRDPTIAGLLEEARKRRGLSVRKAARLLGTTETTWRAWQRGQNPGTKWAGRFAEFTDQDEAYILRRLLELEDGVSPTLLERMGEARYAPVAQLTQPVPTLHLAKVA